MEIYVKDLKISKGFYIALPSKTRKRWGLAPGDEVRLVDTGQEIFIRPLKKDVRLTDIIGKYQTDREFDSVLEHDEVVSGEH